MLLITKKYIITLFCIFLQMLSYILYFFSGFFPRDSKIWLFGCWNGRKFRGNSKHLYFYVKNNYSDIRAVWITKDYSLSLKLREDNIDAYYAYSLRGMLITLRAKYFIVTHGIRDVNEFVSRGGIMINLDHAIYPIKDMSLSLRCSLFWKIYNYLRNSYAYLIKPDYAITSSKFTFAATKHHYKISDDRIIPTGTPKTDLLLDPGSDNVALNRDKDYAAFCATGRRRLFLLPTWRSDSMFSIFKFGFDLKALDQLLEEIKAIIAIGFHPNTPKRQKIPNFNGYNNIKSFSYSGDEINKILSKTDLLITDYSSLFADFLIYDKPFVFAKFDYEGYRKEHGFFVDYDNDLPGPKARNWPEVLDYIGDIFIRGNDQYQMKRRQLKSLIYPRLDGKACERISQFILSLSSS